MDPTPTPRALAEAAYDALDPREQLAGLHRDIAYIEALDAERAPVLTLRAEPDNPADEELTLTITGAEFLADFKFLVLARLRKLSNEAVAAVRQAGIPAGCTSSELAVGNGLTVTIVHRSGTPPLAHSEAAVVRD